MTHYSRRVAAQISAAIFILALIWTPQIKAQNHDGPLELAWYDSREGSRYGWLWVRNDCAKVTSIDCLRYLAQVPISDISPGDIVHVTAQACVTNNDLRSRGLAVNWVTRIVIEPTSGNNFTLETDSDNIVSVPDGHVGMKFNSNISSATHHGCREQSTTWVVPEDIPEEDFWYAKLVSRAHNLRWEKGDKLLIQANGGRVRIEVTIYEPQ